MISAINLRRACAPILAAAMLALAGPAGAQEISASHLAAARQAVAAIGATDEFDGILPQAALSLKAELIQNNPNLQTLISATVDAKALELARRRADLENEAASAYARVFSEAQLNEIASFYNSETGQKLLTDGVIVTREVMTAAQIWQNGIARDLAIAVGQELTEAVGVQVPEPQPAESPTE